MNKASITRLFKSFGNQVSKHSPEILTGIGIAGMVSTVVLAVKATPKAMELISEAEEDGRLKLEKADKYDNKHIDALVKEVHKPINVIKVAWKPYLPAAVTGVASIACIIGANSVHVRRNAALATAYQLSTTALAEFKEKATEVVGEEKVKEIRDKVVEKKIESGEAAPKSNVIPSMKDVIFYDVAFGQTFYSDVETVRKAVNDINYEMLVGQYASLNDFYDLLNIDRIDIGDTLGWNISRHGQLEVSYDSTSVTKDGRPCYVLEYHKAPEYDYYKL